jgi:preprotein translocase subunit YajC
MFIRDAYAQDAKPVTASTEVAEAQAPYALSVDKMMMDTVVFIALLFGIFYFLLIRPQQKRYKEYKKMLDSIQKGSRVVTGGGIIGVVSKVEAGDILLVEIAPNVKVKVSKASIGEVLGDGKSVGDTANDN